MIRQLPYYILPKSLIAWIRRYLLVPARRKYGRQIPVAMITGTCGKTTTTRMLAYILAASGQKVGFTSTDGIVINGEQICHEDSSGYKGAKRVINDRNISVAVLEIARGDLIRFGLYRDRCQAAAMLNVGREQIEIDGIDTLEQMAQLKKQVIDASTGTVVLNADDPQCARFVDLYPSDRLTLFSMNEDNTIITQHLEKNGTAYVVSQTETGDIIQRIDGKNRETLLAISDLPACANGLFRQNIANAMAAAALAEGMQVSRNNIRKALGNFDSSLELSFGRCNLINGYSQRILFDRAISVPACESIVSCLRNVPVDGNRICILHGVGNRPDWTYHEMGELLGPCFDLVICFDSELYCRGRLPGEVPQALRAGFLKGGVAADCIYVTPDRKSAFDALSRIVKENDLVAIFMAEHNQEKLSSLLENSLAQFAVKH